MNEIKWGNRALRRCLWVVASIFPIVVFASWLHLGWPKPVVRYPSCEVYDLIRRNLALSNDILAVYDARTMTTKDSPWALWHGILGHLRDYSIIDDDGKEISCLRWLLCGSEPRGESSGTSIVAGTSRGFQFKNNDCQGANNRFEGHFCQWLWILLQCGEDLHKLEVVFPDRQHIPAAQILETSLLECHEFVDASWALPVFTKSLSRCEWDTGFNVKYTLGRLLDQHLRRERSCGACFGTHWRMGLAESLPLLQGRVSEALHRKASRRLCECLAEARASMSDDGQFQLKWGVYPPMPPEKDPPMLPTDDTALISHQGHMLAWVVVALDRTSFLQELWPHRAAAWLMQRLVLASPTEITYQAHSHAAHGLRLYIRRVRSTITYDIFRTFEKKVGSP